MLSASLLADMQRSYAMVIDTLGVPVACVHIKTGATVNTIAGMKVAGDRDEAIIQSFGVGVRIFTFKASDFVIPIEKFDKISIGAEVFVAEAVHHIHLNAGLVGYKVYAKGK